MIEVKQICDRCGKSRVIATSANEQRKMNGWRILPTDKKIGEGRSEQPCVCPDCLDVIHGFIKAGPDAVIVIRSVEAL